MLNARSRLRTPDEIHITTKHCVVQPKLHDFPHFGTSELIRVHKHKYDVQEYFTQLIMHYCYAKEWGSYDARQGN